MLLKEKNNAEKKQNIPWEDKVEAESQLSFTSTAPTTHEAAVQCSSDAV